MYNNHEHLQRDALCGHTAVGRACAAACVTYPGCSTAAGTPRERQSWAQRSRRWRNAPACAQRTPHCKRVLGPLVRMRSRKTYLDRYAAIQPQPAYSLSWQRWPLIHSHSHLACYVDHSVQCGAIHPIGPALQHVTQVDHKTPWPARGSRRVPLWSAPVLFQPFDYPLDIPYVCSNSAGMHVTGSRLHGWWLGCFAGIDCIQPGCFVHLYTWPLDCPTGMD